MKHLGTKTLAIAVLVFSLGGLILNGIDRAYGNFNATDLLGQLDGLGVPDFAAVTANNSAGVGNTNNIGFDDPQSIALDTVNHRLFVADSDNNRIVMFNLSATNNINDYVADAVIGQDDFTSNQINKGLGSINAAGLNDPQGVEYVNNELFVSDSLNHRVLIFPVPVGFANGISAIDQFGQADFTSGLSNRGNPTPNNNTFNNPKGLTTDISRDLLFVADLLNDRVLVFDINPATRGSGALYVLGEPNFTTGSGTSTQTRLNNPYDVDFDAVNTRLFVADGQNRRVIVYDVRNAGSAPLNLCPLIDPVVTTGLANGMNASCRLGQANWTDNTPGVTDHDFEIIEGVTYDPDKEILYVMDISSRVTTFDISTFSPYPTETAIGVFGQADFTTAGAIDHTAGGMRDPAALVYNPVNQNFFVADRYNRILYFEFVHITSTLVSDGTVGFAYNEPIAYTDSQGTATMQVTAGSLPPGISISGTSLTGMPTLQGVYNFTLQIIDNAPGVGSFYSEEVPFTLTVNLLPPGFDISPISGDTTELGNGTATFTMALTSPTLPGEDVTIALSSSDLTEGTVSPSSLTFTNGNWNVPQTVTVTGQDDPIADGNISYNVVTANAVSTYAEYSNRNVPDIGVVNIDNEIPGFTVGAISAHTTEALGTATFDISINTQPLSNVVVPLSSNDTTEGTLSIPSVTFTPLNWTVTQTVTVTGVNDDIDDGDIAYSIITGAPVTGDATYAALSVNNVPVINDDDGDTAGVSLSLIDQNTTEGGTNGTFSIVLTSEPTADVTITLLSSDTSEGVITTPSVTFTSADWDTPQLILVEGVDDAIDDGDIAYSIITGDATSLDATYDTMIVDDVAVINIDNDATPTGGGVVLIETFDLHIIRQPTATSVDAQFIISTYNNGSGTVWEMVYSTNANALATLPHVPYAQQLNNIAIPRGATHLYARYFDVNNPTHVSPIVSRPLQLFDQEPDQPVDSSDCTPYLTKYLVMGGLNDTAEVVKLQTFLREEEGFSQVVINGVFDRATYNAVVNFQERYFAYILAPWFNSHGTGRVFVTTKKKINELHCAGMAKPLKECRQFTDYAKLNEQNNPEEVKKIQDFLKSELFLTNDSSTSGSFDVLLDDAIRRFQASYPDDIITPWGSRDQESQGWWYVTTQAKANQLYCAKNPS